MEKFGHYSVNCGCCRIINKIEKQMPKTLFWKFNFNASKNAIVHMSVACNIVHNKYKYQNLGVW